MKCVYILLSMNFCTFVIFKFISVINPEVDIERNTTPKKRVVNRERSKHSVHYEKMKKRALDEYQNYTVKMKMASSAL